MLCMSSAGIPGKVFIGDPPTSRSAMANGTIHLTHSSISTHFRAGGTEGFTHWYVKAMKPQSLQWGWFWICSFYLKHFPPAPERRSERGLKQQECHWKTQDNAHLAYTGPTARKEEKSYCNYAWQNRYWKRGTYKKDQTYIEWATTEINVVFP